MSTLTVFSEKERQYDRYQARQEYLRQQMSIQQELERLTKSEQAAKQLAEEAIKDKEAAQQHAKKAIEEAIRDKEEAIKREEKSQLENQQLKELLKQIKP